MDPLSLTASAIAIIQLTTDLVKGTRNLYKTIKKAPEEVGELLDELNVFGIVLERLNDVAQQAEKTKLPRPAANGAATPQTLSRLPTLQSMIEPNGSLATCYAEMLGLKIKLTSDHSKLKKSLKWPFQKDEILGVVQRLRTLRSILNSAIIGDQL